MPQSTLLVVVDPTAEHQLALMRAEQLAVDTGAKLHLFCCDYLDDISDFNSRRDAKHTLLKQNSAALQDLAAPLRKEGIQVSVEAYWNDDWVTSTVHEAVRCGADMIIKSYSSHTRLERYTSSTSDRTMIRSAQCPTLLVKSDSPWTQQALLAAVALDKSDEHHVFLNNAVVARAQRLAKATQSKLHLVSAINDRPDLADVLKLLDNDAETDEAMVAERYGVDVDRIHFDKGSAHKVITNTANDLRVDALVIGSVGRTGVGAAVIGNTAEKVLDQVEMDILVVNG